MTKEQLEILIFDVWVKEDVGFERIASVLASDVEVLEKTFKTVRCGTALVLL